MKSKYGHQTLVKWVGGYDGHKSFSVRNSSKKQFYFVDPTAERVVFSNLWSLERLVDVDFRPVDFRPF